MQNSNLEQLVQAGIHPPELFEIVVETPSEIPAIPLPIPPRSENFATWLFTATQHVRANG